MMDGEKENFIDQFLRGELKGNDLQLFEKMLTEDEAFQKDYRQKKIIRDTLAYGVLKNNLKQQLENDHVAVPQMKKHSGLRPWMAVAASLVFILAFMGYAYTQLGWFRNDISKVSDYAARDTARLQQPPINDIEFSVVNASVKNILLPADQYAEISTRSGVFFTFPAGSFQASTTAPDSIIITYTEIINKDILQSSDTGRKISKVFRLNFAESYWQINPLQPPSFSISQVPKSEKLTLYYGGNNEQVEAWRIAADVTSNFINKPSPIMEEYSRYQASVALLDSVANYYTKAGDIYIANQGGMQLNASFLEERKAFVQQYEHEKSFRYNYALAQKQWDLYNAQRNIQVTQNNREAQSESKQLFITLPGWYAIIQEKE